MEGARSGRAGLAEAAGSAVLDLCSRAGTAMRGDGASVTGTAQPLPRRCRGVPWIEALRARPEPVLGAALAEPDDALTTRVGDTCDESGASRDGRGSGNGCDGASTTPGRRDTLLPAEVDACEPVQTGSCGVVAAEKAKEVADELGPDGRELVSDALLRLRDGSRLRSVDTLDTVCVELAGRDSGCVEGASMLGGTGNEGTSGTGRESVSRTVRTACRAAIEAGSDRVTSAGSASVRPWS